MKKKSLLLILMILISTSLLTACGEKKPTVNVYNWGDYMDKEIFKDFEEEYGIKVKYDEFATNEDLYVKIKQGGSKFDVIFPSDYMIERMIREDLLQKINKDNLDNIKYIDEEFMDPDYDPGNQYSLPYLWGTVGIIYNKTMIDEDLDSWADLWNEKYKDQIIMLKSQRDTIAVALKKLGYSMNTRNLDELHEAKDELIKQKHLVYSYLGDEVKDVIIGGDAAIAVVWSGDAVEMIRENPDLEYIIPKEGTNLWYDSIVIPKNAPNLDGAEKFINFLSRPDIAARNADYIGYSTPISAAREMLPDDLRESLVAYPTREMIEDTEVFKDPTDIVIEYDNIWTDIMSAN